MAPSTSWVVLVYVHSLGLDRNVTCLASFADLVFLQRWNSSLPSGDSLYCFLFLFLNRYSSPLSLIA